MDEQQEKINKLARDQRFEWLAQQVDEAAPTLNALSDHCHESSVLAGWWNDLDMIKNELSTAHDAERLTALVEMWFQATKIALIHSEISEMMEGLRKGINDDHLPERPMVDVEGADGLIRIFDFMGARRADLGGATAEKFRYNHKRADHKPENREAEGGKNF